LRADRDRLCRLVENLLHNAVEHGGSGVTITVGATDEGFYVADDGPGIPPDRRDRVFESGYSTAAAGTGFGLSIVAEIAEAHDWSVTATESAAGGTRIEITGVEGGS
jgi:signal transduction histidine kinase